MSQFWRNFYINVKFTTRSQFLVFRRMWNIWMCSCIWPSCKLIGFHGISPLAFGRISNGCEPFKYIHLFDHRATSSGFLKWRSFFPFFLPTYSSRINAQNRQAWLNFSNIFFRALFPFSWCNLISLSPYSYGYLLKIDN